MFEFVYDGRTDGRRLDGYTISSPCEPYGSGELTMGEIWGQNRNNNQRTNGPVNAHLISWPTLVKHKTYKT